MEIDHQHSDSDSDSNGSNSSSNNDNNSDIDDRVPKNQEPVYYSDYDDYKKTEWTTYDYCSDSSADESIQKVSASKDNEETKQKPPPNLPRLFGYSPALFCRFGGKVICVPETPEENCKWKKEGQCQSCYGPTQPFFERCNSNCFKDRGDEPRNKLGHFIFCSFHQRLRDPR